MTSTLLIVQIVLAIAITISVLLQKSSSIGLGAYSGSNESMFGAKGPMGFLAKLTFTLGLVFILNTLVLGYLYTKESNKTVADTIVKSPIPASPEKKSTTAPAAPSAPAAKTEESAPAAAPAVPAAPKSAAKSDSETNTSH
jgi:preprotein translocase subunit SecG